MEICLPVPVSSVGCHQLERRVLALPDLRSAETLTTVFGQVQVLHAVMFGLQLWRQVLVAISNCLGKGSSAGEIWPSDCSISRNSNGSCAEPATTIRSCPDDPWVSGNTPLCAPNGRQGQASHCAECLRTRSQRVRRRGNCAGCVRPWSGRRG